MSSSSRYTPLASHRPNHHDPQYVSYSYPSVDELLFQVHVRFPDVAFVSFDELKGLEEHLALTIRLRELLRDDDGDDEVSDAIFFVQDSMARMIEQNEDVEGVLSFLRRKAKRLISELTPQSRHRRSEPHPKESQLCSPTYVCKFPGDSYFSFTMPLDPYRLFELSLSELRLFDRFLSNPAFSQQVCEGSNRSNSDSIELIQMCIADLVTVGEKYNRRHPGKKPSADWQYLMECMIENRLRVDEVERDVYEAPIFGIRGGDGLRMSRDDGRLDRFVEDLVHPPPREELSEMEWRDEQMRQLDKQQKRLDKLNAFAHERFYGLPPRYYSSRDEYPSLEDNIVINPRNKHPLHPTHDSCKPNTHFSPSFPKPEELCDDCVFAPVLFANVEFVDYFDFFYVVTGFTIIEVELLSLGVLRLKGAKSGRWRTGVGEFAGTKWGMKLLWENGFDDRGRLAGAGALPPSGWFYDPSSGQELLAEPYEIRAESDCRRQEYRHSPSPRYGVQRMLNEGYLFESEPTSPYYDNFVPEFVSHRKPRHLYRSTGLDNPLFYGMPGLHVVKLHDQLERLNSETSHRPVRTHRSNRDVSPYGTRIHTVNNTPSPFRSISLSPHVSTIEKRNRRSNAPSPPSLASPAGRKHRHSIHPATYSDEEFTKLKRPVLRKKASSKILNKGQGRSKRMGEGKQSKYQAYASELEDEAGVGGWRDV